MRTFLAVSLLVLLLGGLGTFTWMTQYPEAEWIERAERWPVVGKAAAAFRKKWLPPSARGEGRANWTENGDPDVVVLTRRGPVLGVSPYEWVSPESSLYAAPGEGAEVVKRFEVYANLSVLERQGEWARVEHEGASGWIRIASGQEPIFGSDPAPNVPRPGRGPDPERLARARRVLGNEGFEGKLGPYSLWTDLQDRTLLSLLGRVASTVEGVYQERYGRTPLPGAAEAVIVFRREESYRRFQAAEKGLAGLPAAGHSGHGLVAFYVGDRTTNDVAATLAHELTHALNRRAIGPPLPAWLEEGLAGDLGGSLVTEDGRLDPTRPGGEAHVDAEFITYSGLRASLLNGSRAIGSGKLPPLRRLIEMEDRRFLVPLPGERNHAHAALLVRYLLNGDNGTHADGFRDFLESVSRGGPPSGDELLRHLDTTWGRLEAGFRAYVTQVAALI